MKLRLILLLLVMLLGFLILYFVFFVSEGGLLSGLPVFDDEGGRGDDTSENNGAGNGLGASSSGSDSGASEAVGSSGAGVESGCVSQQIAYSAINFNRISVCNEYQEEICIDKTITCSVDVNNLDHETGGIFEIAFRFFEEGGENSTIFSTSSEYFIESFGSHNFESVFDAYEEDANKDIDCFYNTLSVPRGEFC